MKWSLFHDLISPTNLTKFDYVFEFAFFLAKLGKIYANKINKCVLLRTRTHDYQETANKSGLLKHPNKIITNFIMHNQVLYLQKIIEILAFAHNKFIQNLKRFFLHLPKTTL
jgi:hypothetical protein